MSSFLRGLGAYDKADPASYKRFNSAPKSVTSHILYRGETRSPRMIKQSGGFHPQPGKSHVSDTGGSTSMVCLTLDPEVGATYYAYVKNYFGKPTWGENKPYGYVYAVFLPTGRGILNYKMAEATGSSNVGSQEISALIVPWNNVVGWRQLPSPDDCKPVPGVDYHLVDWRGAYEPNADFAGDWSVVSADSKGTFQEFSEPSNLVIYNNKKL